ncbi:hypothetical protein [Nocardia brasiliensis]|uniref:hypothetical protein n=1 Tax=Nocardia brasiliensis TaxID=37326 RepID=UPI001893CBA3|nr:hypothetical protein [Nocardia brasiliensis]MBF6125518.1 hypothetical protein [Nocardia brasiliensis]
MTPGESPVEPELRQARLNEIEAIEPGLDEVLGIQPQFDEGSVTEPDLDLDVPPEPSSPPDRLHREFRHTTTPFIVTTAQEVRRR